METGERINYGARTENSWGRFFIIYFFHLENLKMLFHVLSQRNIKN